MFKGSLVALITPWSNHTLDIPTLEKILKWQVAAGSHGIVVCGTTAEAPMMSQDEKNIVIQKAVEIAGPHVPIIVGASALSPTEVIAQSQKAEQLGAQAVLVTPPSYVRPSQEAIYSFFEAIHAETSLPLILYENPPRVGVSFTNDTILRLSHLSRIVGIKDGSGVLQRPTELRQHIHKDFCYLSGNDQTNPGFLAQGGDGMISAVANFAPLHCAELWNSWQRNDLSAFEDWRDLLHAALRLIEQAPNPTGVKAALSLIGVCQDSVRQPLQPPHVSFYNDMDTFLNDVPTFGHVWQQFKNEEGA